MEEHFLPVAAKIGSQRHLVAVRDAFIGIMPITMVGSIAVLLNVFVRDLPGEWGWTSFVEAMTPLIGVNGNVWFGSIAILAMVFVFSLGYNLSQSYEVNPLAGGVVAFSALITTMPQVATVGEDAAWGFIGLGYTGATELFTALIVGLIATMVYVKLMERDVTIKMPEGVPEAVSRAFAAIIPGVVAVYVVAIIGYISMTYLGQSLNDLILYYIQTPLLGLSQGLFSVLLATFLVQLFWFFGLKDTTSLHLYLMEFTYQPY